MPPRLLDKQSLLNRELEIIKAALEIIQREGVESLTIDKIVTLVPFSKGTIYKHFLSKEDVTLAIANQAISILSDFFNRAANFKGCSRERMILLNASYLIYAILHPVFFKIDLCAKSPIFLKNCDQKRVNTQEMHQMTLMSSIESIIKKAIDCNSLILPTFMNVQQVCFSNWSMNHGIISLLSKDIEACHDLIVDREIFNNSCILFDGLNWSPLTKEKDYKKALTQALKTIFPEELKEMSKLGRVLNF